MSIRVLVADDQSIVRAGFRLLLSGKGDMVHVKIDPSLLKPGEAEILEDLIVAAHNDAKAKVEQAMKEKMKSLTGGLPLPPGLKLF